MVNARDEGAKSEQFNLLQYCFTKKVILGSDQHGNFDENDYEIALMRAYNENKGELLMFIS